MSKKIKSCVVVATTQGQSDQRREVIALPIDYVSGFLFSINAARVKEDVRDKLMLYQERCYQVLAEAFKSGELTAEDDIETLAAIDPDAAEAIVMAQVVLKIARAHLRLAKTAQRNRGDIDKSMQRNVGSCIWVCWHIVKVSVQKRKSALFVVKLNGRFDIGWVWCEIARYLLMVDNLSTIKLR